MAAAGRVDVPHISNVPGVVVLSSRGPLQSSSDERRQLARGSPDQPTIFLSMWEFEVANTYRYGSVPESMDDPKNKNNISVRGVQVEMCGRGRHPPIGSASPSSEIEHISSTCCTYMTLQWLTILLWPAKQNSTKRAFDLWHLRCIVWINVGVIAFKMWYIIVGHSIYVYLHRSVRMAVW